MKIISFKIFIPRKRFKIKTELLCVTAIFTPIIFGIISERYYNSFYQFYEVGKYVKIIGTAALVVTFIMYLLSFSRRKRLEGKFAGYLELKEDRIIISNRSYELDKIKSIDFIADDFIDKFPFSSKGLNPKRSRGVENKCAIEFINGEKLEVKHFGQDLMTAPIS